MNEPTVTRKLNPNWGEFRDLGETLSECFSLEASADSEPWFEAYFPFYWSCGPDGTDGIGGPPVTNPLEFRVYLSDMSTNAAVIRHYALDEILKEDIEGHVGRDGKYADEDGRAWAERTAAALEELARELRKAL